LAEKLATALVGKMSPEMIVGSVLGCAAIAGGVLSYRAFLRHRSEDKKIETAMQERVAMSQEETKRQAVLAKVITLRLLESDAGRVL
jgi:hypothetical protein